MRIGFPSRCERISVLQLVPVRHMLPAMYWRIEGFPELQHLDPADRRRLVRECFGRGGFVRWTLLNVLVGAFFGGSGALLVADVAGIGAGQEIWLVAPMVFVAILAVYQVRLLQIRGQLIIYLERAAREQRLPMCLGCGYDLTGLTSDTCPECGMRIAEKKRPDG